MAVTPASPAEWMVTSVCHKEPSVPSVLAAAGHHPVLGQPGLGGFGLGLRDRWDRWTADRPSSRRPRNPAPRRSCLHPRFPLEFVEPPRCSPSLRARTRAGCRCAGCGRGGRGDSRRLPTSVAPRVEDLDQEGLFDEAGRVDDAEVGSEVIGRLETQNSPFLSGQDPILAPGHRRDTLAVRSAFPRPCSRVHHDRDRLPIGVPAPRSQAHRWRTRETVAQHIPQI